MSTAKESTHDDDDAAWAAAIGDVRAYMAQAFAKLGALSPTGKDMAFQMFTDATVEKDARRARTALTTVAVERQHAHCKGCLCRQLSIIAFGIEEAYGPISGMMLEAALNSYTRWHHQREQKHALS